MSERISREGGPDQPATGRQHRRGQRLKICAALGAGLILGSGGVAIAAPTATTISACRNTSTGVLRIPNTGQRCTKSEKAVTWNSQGPTGVRGLPGAAGPAGPVGPAGTFPLDRLRERETPRPSTFTYTLTADDWTPDGNSYSTALTKIEPYTPGCLSGEQLLKVNEAGLDRPYQITNGDDVFEAQYDSTSHELTLNYQASTEFPEGPPASAVVTLTVDALCRSFYLAPTP